MIDPRPGLRFPTSFPITVIGLQSDSFIPQVKEIVEKHVGILTDQAFSSRMSGSGKYCSLTVTFSATSREQIEDLYRELRNSSLVIIVL